MKPIPLHPAFKELFKAHLIAFFQIFASAQQDDLYLLEEDFEIWDLEIIYLH